MLHLGRKSQVKKCQVMNNWVCSTTPGKDLHISGMEQCYDMHKVVISHHLFCSEKGRI